MRRNIDRPKSDETTRHETIQSTHKLHYSSDRPLDIDPVIAIYSNQARRTADGWELDKSRVVGHDRLEVFSPIKNHPIELARNDDSVARDNVLTLCKMKLAGSQACRSETNFVCRKLEEHISSSLNTKKLTSDPYDVWIVSLLMLTALSLARLNTTIGGD